MSLRMLCVMAHPDDESLGMGGTIARYASEGVEISLLTATRGERGRFGDKGERPGIAIVGRTREVELREAAQVLGIRDVTFLNYIDGDLDKASPEQAIRKIVHVIRCKRPQVVVTFAPDGAYGHPDHIAISQFTTAAVTAAAHPFYAWDEKWSMSGVAHCVKKLYYMAWDKAKWDAYQAALKKLVSRVDGEERQATPWPDWSITTEIDTTNHWRTAWDAICCHRTQMAIYQNLATLPEEMHLKLWGSQTFYRAFSLVNGGRALETDLFAGIRETNRSQMDPEPEGNLVAA